MTTASHRLLIPTVLVVLAAAAPGFAQGKGGTKDGGNRRAFYLTKAEHFTIHAETACEAGFHMASLFEIADVSALKYDTSRGHTKADAGAGPPSFAHGWIRTGDDASGSTTPGRGNCQNWTETSGPAAGTVVWIRSSWLGAATHTGLWDASISSCNEIQRVWCVQD